MKKRTLQILTVMGFIGFLLAMLLGTVLIPKEAFSQREKRYLAEFPQPQWDNIISGAWSDGLESWLADHIPLREFFVGLDAYKEYLLGQQTASEIRVIDGRLVEAPVTVDQEALEKNLNTIDSFAGKLDCGMTLALVPSAGWATGREAWKVDAIIFDIYERVSVDTLNLTECFRGKPELFYQTDHHWTSQGAYTGYQAIAAHFGREAAEQFTRERIPDCFRGSTYSRSALWLTEPEDMELWHGSDDIRYIASDSPDPQKVFCRDRLTEADPYLVFLDGNHPLVRLYNPNASGRLLVIRDSYSNCLGPFLAESYGEVVMADLRYYRLPLSTLAAEGFDQVLMIYSLNSFLTDPFIILLR